VIDRVGDGVEQLLSRFRARVRHLTETSPKSQGRLDVGLREPSRGTGEPCFDDELA
jgi:hypothetical protein